MAVLDDQEIYRRTVDEVPFAEDEQDARFRYWRARSAQERIQAGHELLKRHYIKLGVDVDSLRVDKTAVCFALLREQGD